MPQPWAEQVVTYGMTWLQELQVCTMRPDPQILHLESQELSLSWTRTGFLRKYKLPENGGTLRLTH
jgi:hypothetical protein